MGGRRQSTDFPSLRLLLHEMFSIDHRRRASRKRTFGGPLNAEEEGNGISLALDRLSQTSSGQAETEKEML